jgi:hypothetical protein
MASGSSSSARQPQPLAGPMSTRLEKSKFRYPVEHGAAFVELRDDTMSGEEVFQILETVPCVGRVYWQISKHAQGNKSLRPVGTPYTGVGHLPEQNVMVKSMLFRRPFEFELTLEQALPRLIMSSIMRIQRAPPTLHCLRLLLLQYLEQALPLLILPSIMSISMMPTSAR